MNDVTTEELRTMLEEARKAVQAAESRLSTIIDSARIVSMALLGLSAHVEGLTERVLRHEDPPAPSDLEPTPTGN